MIRAALLFVLAAASPAAADAIPGFPAFSAFLAAERAGARADLEAAGALPVTITDEPRGSLSGYASNLRTIRAGGALILEAATWGSEGPVRLDRFFGPGPALDEALIALSAHLLARLDAAFGPAPAFGARAQATAPDLAVLSHFTLMPGGEGLAFHFAPGEAAPEAAGPVEIRARTPVFAAHLNPEGLRVFGRE